MFRKLIHKIAHPEDSWSTDQWRQHLLRTASSQSQRDEIIIMFPYKGAP